MSEREKTRLVHVSRVRPVGSVETVNPPVVRCSTVLYRDIATRREVRARREQGERLFMYGASGTPTAFALEDAISEKSKVASAACCCRWDGRPLRMCSCRS